MGMKNADIRAFLGKKAEPQPKAQEQKAKSKRKAKQAPHSPPTAQRKSLRSLPLEILAQIALLLDKPSAVSLSRVAPFLSGPAEYRIWQDLDLSLNPHYGELPLIQPYDRDEDGHLRWAKAEARRAENRHTAGVREKVLMLTEEVNKRRLGLVRSVKVVPRTGALHAIIQLFGAISPVLRSLEIAAPASHVFDDDWRPSNFGTIDYRLLKSGLTFPSLTHIRLGDRAIRFPGFLLLLCASAPNLLTLECELECPDEQPEKHDSIPIFPLLSSPTKLQTLHIRLDMDVPDHANVETHPLANLVSHSPDLRRVSFQRHGEFECDPDDLHLEEHLLKLLAGKVSLRELEYPSTLQSFATQARLAMVKEPFPALERLMLYAQDDLELVSAASIRQLIQFRGLPKLSHLHTLYIDETETRCYRSLRQPIKTDFPEAPLPFDVLPLFAAGLRDCPSLTHIHTLNERASLAKFDIFDEMDRIDTQPDTAGRVRSLRHGKAELVHTRLYLHWFEADELDPDEIYYEEGDSTTISYTGRDGSAREKTYEWREEGAWFESAEYEGRSVPLDVLRRMRRRVGARLGGWEGRNVEVGPYAWEVLKDWKADQDEADKAITKAAGKP